MPGPLTDGVIVLDRLTEADIPVHLAGEDEETARRFGWWPARSTEETARAAFAHYAENWAAGGPTRTFATRDAAALRLVGGCELRLQGDGSGQVSYWTLAGERRRGYAARALALLLDYARSLGVTRLESHVAPDNHASRRVSEKNGFRPGDPFRDDAGTLLIRYELPLSSPGGPQ